MAEPIILPTRFTAEDAERANQEWGANCGPAAIAAICGMSLSEVRPHLGDFEQKRYTNPTLMWDILTRLESVMALRWKRVFPQRMVRYGLARVQWHGPWMGPDVPPAARYRHTHWIGYAQKSSTAVFDVNALSNGSGWCSFDNWASILVPLILKECEPKADGEWSLTHSAEITFHDGAVAHV